VDVIVGFPGETDVEFMQTFDFIRDLDVSYLHVFTYSERDHTLAAEMDAVVPVHIRKQRNKMLRILSDKKSQAFGESQVGALQQVLFESEQKNGMMFGYTPNYIRVCAEYRAEHSNQIIEMQLTGYDTSGMMRGESIPELAPPTSEH
jgi:threonylcarbamoyladenosine tRNA methylthiotransferase MtaB